MAAHDGNKSPTPSQQDDYGDKNNGTEYEEERAQENVITVNDQDREPDRQTDNEENPNAATSNVLTESTMDAENGSVTNQDTAQSAQLGLNTVIMDDQDAGPDLEEQLGGVIVGEIEHADGQVELLVMSISASQGTPEL